MEINKQPLSHEELHAALLDMEKGKNPSQDGIILEFYTTYWDLIGNKYLQMLLKALSAGRLPQVSINISQIF
jgi:hypothetical protein